MTRVYYLIQIVHITAYPIKMLSYSCFIKYYFIFFLTDSEEEPNFDLTSDESPETENYDLYQHDASASETLPINENYVMINKSNYVKTQIVLTLILAIFMII